MSVYDDELWPNLEGVDELTDDSLPNLEVEEVDEVSPYLDLVGSRNEDELKVEEPPDARLFSLDLKPGL